MRYILLLFIFLNVSLLTTSIKADNRNKIINQKSEMESIKVEVKESQKRLDSLKSEGITIQKQISDIDQRIVTNQKVIKRLNQQLNGVHGKIGDTEDKLNQNKNRFNTAQNRYLGDICKFYVRAVRLPRESFWETPMAEVKRTRQNMYLAALADFESKNIDKAAISITQIVDSLNQLTNEKERVASLKKNKEVATALEKSRKLKEKKSLESLRREKMSESDRMLTLQQAAKEIEQIIVRLENERRKRQQANQSRPTEPSIFVTLKGQLTCPYQGKIVVPFGSSVDPVTRLESFSSGITIKGRPSAPVVTVAGGDVVYIGNLRGYGNFVIISHDEQYYSTYGGLGKVTVNLGEYVPSETILAAAGDNGLVKFELRSGREPLDPVKWIRIDTF